MAERVVVVGGTIAALVAADALARAGRPVRLLLPSKGVGGGFMPIVRGGLRLDRGLRLLELRYEDVGEPPPLETYTPGEHGHRPFIGLIEEWVRELAGGRVVEVPPGATVLDGRIGPDVLMSTDLAPVRELVGEAAADVIAAEARAAADTLGDAGVLGAPEGLWSMSLDDASRANHGMAFHERLIAPVAEKLRPEGAGDVPAMLRRKLWLPLWWPRTVWEACSGHSLSFVAHRPFHTVLGGGTGVVVELLLARVEAASLVEVVRCAGIEGVRAEGAGVRVEWVAATTMSEVVRRPILALAPGELFSAAGVEYTPDRVRSALAWVQVSEDDLVSLPGFVMVVDPALAVFRITPGEVADGRRLLCLELRHDAREEDVEAAARAALPGVLREGAAIEVVAFFAGPTFTAPTFAALEEFAAARNALKALALDAQIIGGAEAFGADAFNEQVIQGLAAATRA